MSCYQDTGSEGLHVQRPGDRGPWPRIEAIGVRYALILLLLALPLWGQAAAWTGPVGPSATVWLSLENGRFSLTFEERWTESPRSSTAAGTYALEGELLELTVESVTFDGEGAASRNPAEGFTIETLRKGVMDSPTPSVTFAPGRYIRLQVTEDDSLLEVRGNGGFELHLVR